MSNALKRAIAQARQAVLTAPDRQSAIEAYRYWYNLKNGKIQFDEPKREQPTVTCGWLQQLEKYYG